MSVSIIGGVWESQLSLQLKKAGNTGNITVFEASSERIDWITETVSLNGIEDRVDIHHALVGARRFSIRDGVRIENRTF